MPTIRIEDARINTDFISDYEIDAWGCLDVRFSHGGTRRFAEDVSVEAVQKLDEHMIRTKSNMVSIPPRKVAKFPVEAA